MRAWLCLGLMILGACSFRRTQCVVEIHADSQIQSSATELRVEVRDQRNAVVFDQLLNPRSTTFPGFPLEIPVSAKGGGANRIFEFRVTALMTHTQGSNVITETLAQNRVRTSFVAGSVTRFRLWLLSGCRCEPDTQRCEPDADGDSVPECLPVDAPSPSGDAGIDSMVDNLDSQSSDTGHRDEQRNGDGSRNDDGGDSTDAANDVPTETNSACVPSPVSATLPRRSVDLIWVVDNSTSMGPAIRDVESGINDFVNLLESSGFDYRVIMLSLRRRRTGASPDPATGTVVRNGATRFPVCLPAPLGGANCTDGARAFHIDMDIRSTMPVEQILGSLAQSNGYREGHEQGGTPWRSLLRPDAFKAFIFVTDDNARTCGELFRCSSGDPPVTALSLENHPGGSNPFTSDQRTLGPGILTSEYGGLFQGYVVHAVYGYSSDATPDTPCRFSGNEVAASSGSTYTTLVQRTGGVRARICDARAVQTFLSHVVEHTGGASIECTFPVPTPPNTTTFTPDTINVEVRGAANHALRRVPNVEGCTANGWYYPSAQFIQLCPDACTLARRELTARNTGIDVSFGCASRM